MQDSISASQARLLVLCIEQNAKAHALPLTDQCNGVGKRSQLAKVQHATT